MATGPRQEISSRIYLRTTTTLVGLHHVTVSVSTWNVQWFWNYAAYSKYCGSCKQCTVRKVLHGRATVTMPVLPLLLFAASWLDTRMPNVGVILDNHAHVHGAPSTPVVRTEHRCRRAVEDNDDIFIFYLQNAWGIARVTKHGSWTRVSYVTPAFTSRKDPHFSMRHRNDAQATKTARTRLTSPFLSSSSQARTRKSDA